MKARGEIRPPGDKSISHRAVLLSTLTEGVMDICGLLRSQDVLSSCQAVQSLGIELNSQAELVTIRGKTPREPKKVLDAGNSGTTARLLCGVFASMDGVSTLTGDDSLVKRPMARVIRPLERMGALFLARSGSFLPLSVKGSRLKGITHEMEISSAQVKSALIIAALKAEGTTSIREPWPSRDHTERMLAYLGARLEKKGTAIEITGPQTIQAGEITVPGDPSSAAFPAVWAASTPGSEIRIRDVCLNPTRTAFVSVLARMRAQIVTENTRETCGEPVGDLVVTGGDLLGTTIGGPEIPALIDEIPILAVAAARAHGTTVIQGASELRLKESDRITALTRGFSSLGAEIQELDDGMVIEGPLKLRAGTVQTMGDHRIAMTFAILSRIFDIEVELDDAACVAISYPGFFPSMESLA
ncbi:MAG TPA: 3-phosphoshikimate 1-carboxyvinyltransferase [Deltaproteobacteria bacterium]|nr:3-phosphoshikimate 1-carboxyvinyltransferase [Deltaproteobacteria bacterium]